MNRIEKALRKLSAKERIVVKSLLQKIVLEDYKGLDIKKLKGETDIFRVRKGSLRIIFSNNNAQISLLSIGRRDDNTYKS